MSHNPEEILKQIKEDLLQTLNEKFVGSHNTPELRVIIEQKTASFLEGQGFVDSPFRVEETGKPGVLSITFYDPEVVAILRQPLEEDEEEEVQCDHCGEFVPVEQAHMTYWEEHDLYWYYCDRCENGVFKGGKKQ